MGLHITILAIFLAVAMHRNQGITEDEIVTTRAKREMTTMTGQSESTDERDSTPDYGDVTTKSTSASATTVRGVTQVLNTNSSSLVDMQDRTLTTVTDFGQNTSNSNISGGDFTTQSSSATNVSRTDGVQSSTRVMGDASNVTSTIPPTFFPLEVRFRQCYVRKNSYSVDVRALCCTYEAHGYDMDSLKLSENNLAYVVVEFWFSLFLCLFGLGGNIISFMVLSKERTNTSMFFLRALAANDGIYCLWYILFTPYIIAYDKTKWINSGSRISDIAHWIPLNQGYLGLVNFILQTISIWLVVLLTIDRFIAVSMPLQARLLCTMNKARIQVGILIVLVIGFALPKAFQFTYFLIDNVCFKTPGTRLLKINFTDFGKTYGMTVGYDIIASGLLRYIIPVFSVLIMNILLIRILGNASANRSELVKGAHDGQQGRGITVMLVTVATTYTLLLLPLVGIKILRSLFFFQLNKEIFIHEKLRLYVSYANLAGNLCLRLNSSINFLLYIVVSRKFRKGIVALFRCDRVTVKDTSFSNATQASRASIVYK
ncbi:unnamed protein product [Owenia fusiformis]|uniref:Uncharacterized protein n=1 Tax=Owenia fusiformis TaxID=6347 RepID=A0A8J1T5J8_OWEFU|nr:unnamed protein product [Owenia fusiformis]